MTPVITADADAKDITKSIDFSITFGAGVSLPAGANSLFIKGRYVLGLADIVKAGDVTFMGETEAFEDAKINTRGLQIMGGITFPIGSKQGNFSAVLKLKLFSDPASDPGCHN